MKVCARMAEIRIHEPSICQIINLIEPTSECVTRGGQNVETDATPWADLGEGEGGPDPPPPPENYKRL